LALVCSTGEKDPEYCKALEELGKEEKEENEENEEAAWAGPVPNGRMAKDRKAAWTGMGKGMIEMKDGCVYRKGMLWIPNDKNLI